MIQTTEIILTVSLQTIVLIATIIYFNLQDKLGKKRILNHKEELIKGMIFDKEIEIEFNWIMFRDSEKRLEAYKNQIEENLRLIEEEEAKTPMDMEVCKDLVTKNGYLGYTGKKKDGQAQYREGSPIDEADKDLGRKQAKISKLVMERNYLQTELVAISKLKAKGFAKNFDKNLLEELNK